MAKKIYKGKERRKFTRFDFTVPLAYKICKKKTISKLLKGYTVNISQSGIFCNIKEKVKINDVLWLGFDRGMLSICADLENKSFIYQNGIIGRAVRIERKKDGSYDVGLQFITRQEKNLTHIYPKAHFLADKPIAAKRISDSDEEKEEELPEKDSDDELTRQLDGIDREEQEWEEERQIPDEDQEER